MTNYYYIEDQQIIDHEAHFTLRLDPSCEVYKGHFPTHPIAPGACSLEMIRQCTSIAIGQTVRFMKIKQCKYLLPLEPGIHSVLDLHLAWDDNTITAIMKWQELIAIKLKVSRS